MRRARAERGQAATETMLVMSFLLLLIYGTITLCLFMTTKQMADLAAFGAARTTMVRGYDRVGLELFGLGAYLGIALPARSQVGWLSATQVLFWTQGWWTDRSRNTPGLLEVERPDPNGDWYLVVPYKVPYGLPIFSELPRGGILIEGRSPLVVQPAEFIWRPWDEQ
jgi:hypothetical protein